MENIYRELQVKILTYRLQKNYFKKSQLDLFNDSVKFLLDGVVNGYNATVFAYGATGAGKTYT